MSDHAIKTLQRATYDALIARGAQVMDRLSQSIAVLQGGDNPEKAAQALQQFQQKAGDSRHYLQSHYPASPGPLANFIETLHQLQTGIERGDKAALAVSKEAGNDYRYLLRLHTSGANAHHFYKEVTAYSASSGKPDQEWRRADSYWKDHPRVATADIDPYAAERLMSQEQAKTPEPAATDPAAVVASAHWRGRLSNKGLIPALKPEDMERAHEIGKALDTLHIPYEDDSVRGLFRIKSKGREAFSKIVPPNQWSRG